MIIRLFLLNLYLFLILSISGCGQEQSPILKESAHAAEVKKPDSVHPLVAGYPEFIDSLSYDLIYWKDGSTTPYRKNNNDLTGIDTLTSSEFENYLDMADAAQSLMMDYPALSPLNTPAKNEDPGRIRDYDLLKKVYGRNAAEVEKNLVEIIWLPSSVNKKLRINSRNGAAESLRKISAELDTLPAKFMKYLNNPAGTYKWREIAGSDRLSAHSFGIAIDINVIYSNYWRWDGDNSETRVNYKNSIPAEIVYIFEKNGWIWGGRWYHYDTMHFEYRPELFAAQNEETASDRRK